jgi:hypothetical protein
MFENRAFAGFNGFDLKSLGPRDCAGSSPALGINNFKHIQYIPSKTTIS